MMFSVAMNGSSAMRCASITFGYTTSPSEILIYSCRMLSAARNASDTEILLFAESSSVLSNHWTEDVTAGLIAAVIT